MQELPTIPVPPRGVTHTTGRQWEGASACRRKFLRFFPQGFTDPTYLAWERNYKWEAHQRWNEVLYRAEIERLFQRREFGEIARRAVQIESRTHLLYSFEKMALRDGVRAAADARLFSRGLHQFLFGHDAPGLRFKQWCEVIAALPRKQTRVLTWPLVTIFGFLAFPSRYIFFKPMVMRRAAAKYGFDLPYQSRPNWETYSKFMEFAHIVRNDLGDLHPRDMIDIQSFLWVQGSEEYD